MLAELMIRPAMYVVAIALWTVYPPLLAFVVLVHVATWFFPYTTVYLPHHGYGATPVHQTGTMRGVIMPRLFFEATFHLEHHLYPLVPAHHLRALSRRLEPELRRRGVTPTRVP
jgi:beta-carotene hydroxylase